MKTLTGFQNYSITNDGRVYSHTTERFLKASLNSMGYPLVTLVKSVGHKKSVNVHRLVAEYFVANPNGYKQVNHIDGDRSNNHYSNLEWCNQSMNILHAFRVMKNKRHGSKLTYHDAVKIRQSPESTYKLAREYNVCQATIQKIKTRKTYNEKHEISRYAGY